MLPHFLGLSEMLTDAVMLEYKKEGGGHFILILLRCVDYFSSCKLNCHFEFFACYIPVYKMFQSGSEGENSCSL